MIGAIAGVLVVESVFFWERIGVDDVVGAISVHGVNGVWGVISVGMFANGKYGAGPALPDGTFGAGWNGVVGRTMACRDVSTATLGSFGPNCSTRRSLCVFGFVMAYVWFKFSNLITPIASVQGSRIGRPRWSGNGMPGLSRFRAQGPFHGCMMVGWELLACLGSTVGQSSRTEAPGVTRANLSGGSVGPIVIARISQDSLATA